MNKDWSEKNKEIQKLLGKEATFAEGIEKLIELRGELFGQITSFVNELPKEAFSKMPFAGAEGYHSKTLAYSILHIFRIEDIVAHEMIAGDEEVFYAGDWAKRMNSPISTTGNELEGEEIVTVSEALNVEKLYAYATEVMESTNCILQQLSYKQTKQKFGDEMKEKLGACGGVSEAESANWLIDYWCGKNVCGLIKMPFSRHWIMHIEAMLRIKNQLCKIARKGS